ncbi:MAG: trypsin-like peptidase domain-containing protein [Phycisphaerae bacterium]|nr:trypsin-like peptidase domain-containing protein [Saprospiraceae bacterium]
MPFNGTPLEKFTCLRNRLDMDQKGRTDDPHQFKAFLEELGVPKPEFYATDTGKMLLAAKVETELEHNNLEPDWEFDDVCHLGRDKRCQTGHIIRGMRRRIKRLGKAGQFEEKVTLKCQFRAFLNNAFSTVMIFDRGKLDLKRPPGRYTLPINSIPCRDWLDFSSDDGIDPDIKLCSRTFYANEKIPYTDIFGSGYMINEDTVVTAAHVLEEAFIYGVKPENLRFLRSHYVYDTQNPEIDAYESQIYGLDLEKQDKLIISEQMRNGSKDGDMAWVKVKPLKKSKNFRLRWNGMIDKPVSTEQRVYALGHGLGIPMKISFDGYVQNEVYQNTPSMFTCKLNILPGSSGSPIFDFDTHKLVGIVSGLHKIYTVINKKDGCAEFKIDMTGKASGVATHIAPFLSLDVKEKAEPCNKQTNPTTPHL